MGFWCPFFFKLGTLSPASSPPCVREAHCQRQTAYSCLRFASLLGSPAYCRDRFLAFCLAGANPDETPRFVDAYVTIVGFDKRAASLGKLKVGDRIIAEGKCKADKPYQSMKTGEWAAGLECVYSNWPPVSVAAL